MLVAETVEISIGLILHLVLRFLSHVRLVAVLRTCGRMIKVILHVICIDELLLEVVPFPRVWLKREAVGEEIVGSSILVHTAYEVRDGIEEMLFLHNRSIEDYVVA